MTPHTQPDAPSIARPRVEATDWPQIVRLYGLLSQDAAFAHHRTQLESPSFERQSLADHSSLAKRRVTPLAGKVSDAGSPKKHPRGKSRG